MDVSDQFILQKVIKYYLYVLEQEIMYILILLVLLNIVQALK